VVNRRRGRGDRGELRSEEVLVNFRSAAEAAEINDYSSLVLGSSIRAGHWIPDAVRFLEAHSQEMEKILVAYFTGCLTLVNDTQENRQFAMSNLEQVLELAPSIEPMGFALFAGLLGPNMKSIVPGKSPNGDFRKWDKIRAWARKIRPVLHEKGLRPAGLSPVAAGCELV
jgi:menaquinone-dependent protoporphyrinogen oxidase